MKISCSLLLLDNKIAFLKKINDTNLDLIHIDMMDGKFVENKSYTIKEILKINDISNKKLDIHLMVEKPSTYISKLSLCNAEYITFHIEVKENIESLINEIKGYGFKCGISIKPNTDIEKIIPYLDKIDLVLIMSVEPGYGGQAFLEETYDKIEKIKKEIEKRNIKTVIEVDGGINQEIYQKLHDNNVDIAVIGSYITTSNNYKEIINELKNY